MGIHDCLSWKCCDHVSHFYLQIENEFGNYGYSDHPRDKKHLEFLRDVLISSGIESLLFTSDSPYLTMDWGNIDNCKTAERLKMSNRAVFKD